MSVTDGTCVTDGTFTFLATQTSNLFIMRLGKWFFLHPFIVSITGKKGIIHTCHCGDIFNIKEA